MTDDIVTDLTAWAEDKQDGWSLLQEAADEIERLRAAGDALVDVMDRSEIHDVDDEEWDAAIKSWKEVRS
jgi:hypothetical protein